MEFFVAWSLLLPGLVGQSLHVTPTVRVTFLRVESVPLPLSTSTRESATPATPAILNHLSPHLRHRHPGPGKKGLTPPPKFAQNARNC